jgi:putative transcriptional regulator
MYFENHLLVAMPDLQDPNFKRSVIYLCEHNAEGAMGLVINAPIEMTLGEMLDQAVPEAEVVPEKAKQILIKGGPVNPDRGFVLHKPQQGWEGSIQLNDDFMITTSKDILNVIGNEAGPEQQIIALGYAGWTEGQLEVELAENTWLTIPASSELVFGTPLHRRWEAAVKALGIEPWQLTSSAGHA